MIMTNSPLDEDPYYIKSWEDVGIWCINNNKRDDLIKKINNYIYESNLIEGIPFKNYIKKRRAEMQAEDMKNKLTMVSTINKYPSNHTP